jgi:hypothetical protein
MPLTTFYIVLILVPVFTTAIGNAIVSRHGVYINMNVVNWLIIFFVFGIILDLLIWFIVKIILNPIRIDAISTDDNFCNIRVRNIDKTKNLDNCWCRAEKVFCFDKNNKPKDITKIKNRDHAKFLWANTNQERIMVGCDDQEVLRIAKPNPRDGKMFFDILYSKESDSFQVWKNEIGQYEGKTRITFKVFGKREGGMTYSRSITKNIVLKTYVDEIDGRPKSVVDLRFEDK